MVEMKIAVNRCWGGFGVSKAVYDELGMGWDGYGYDFGEDSKRSDPKLIAAIEKLGTKESSGVHAEIEIVDVPDDVEWYIHDYDGMETVREKHRTW